MVGVRSSTLWPLGDLRLRLGGAADMKLPIASFSTVGAANPAGSPGHVLLN